jgi:hypothetical protein
MRMYILNTHPCASTHSRSITLTRDPFWLSKSVLAIIPVWACFGLFYSWNKVGISDCHKTASCAHYTPLRVYTHPHGSISELCAEKNAHARDACAVPFDARMRGCVALPWINQRVYPRGGVYAWEGGLSYKGVNGLKERSDYQIQYTVRHFNYKTPSSTTKMSYGGIKMHDLDCRSKSKHFCTTDPHTWAYGHILVNCLRGYSIPMVNSGSEVYRTVPNQY